eukprot:768124-Hanusia_phi.AAC.1
MRLRSLVLEENPQPKQQSKHKGDRNPGCALETCKRESSCTIHHQKQLCELPFPATLVFSTTFRFQRLYIWKENASFVARRSKWVIHEAAIPAPFQERSTVPVVYHHQRNKAEPRGDASERYYSLLEDDTAHTSELGSLAIRRCHAIRLQFIEIERYKRTGRTE